MHNIDSDYDILVVIDKTLSSEEKMPFRTKIRKTLLSYGILSDILIQSEQEISQKKQLTGHIVKTILQEGVAIHPEKIEYIKNWLYKANEDIAVIKELSSEKSEYYTTAI